MPMFEIKTFDIQTQKDTTSRTMYFPDYESSVQYCKIMSFPSIYYFVVDLEPWMPEGWKL
jgi:hypothetical protein